MKKLNNSGFGPAALVLAIIVIGAVAATGWYVYSKNQTSKKPNNTNQSSTGSQADSKSDFVYEGVEIPSSWKTYTNNEFGFRFQYPGDFTISDGQLSSEENADKAVFHALILTGAGHGGYEVRVLKTSLKDAVKNDALNVNDNTYKNTVTQKNIYKSGHNAIELSYVPDTGKVSWFFIEKDSNTVIYFDSVADNGKNAEIIKAIYNSLVVN